MAKLVTLIVEKNRNPDPQVCVHRLSLSLSLSLSLKSDAKSKIILKSFDAKRYCNEYPGKIVCFEILGMIGRKTRQKNVLEK